MKNCVKCNELLIWINLLLPGTGSCLYVRVWHEDRLFFTTIYTIIAESGILDVAFRAINFCEIVLGARKLLYLEGLKLTHYKSLCRVT